MSLKSSPDSQTAAQDLPVGLTPELMQWVRDQRASGIGPAALLRSMRDVGWSEELARRALDLPEQGEVSPPAVVVSASSLPEPDLAQDPSSIDVGDRQVQVLVSMRNPRIVGFGNLLSHEECDAIIAAARPRMARSLTVATHSGGEEINDDRTRSEEHTSELQSPCNLVCRLLLEKKNATSAPRRPQPSIIPASPC